MLAYQAALDLYEQPAILYNMAQTYEKLRDPARAAMLFERYLAIKPKAVDRKIVLARIARLKRIAKVEVNITSYPPGAAIYVGDRRQGVMGRTPYKVKLPLGRQRVMLELSGFIPESRSITVELGSNNLLDIQLQRKSSIKVDSDVPGAMAFIDSDTIKQAQRVPQLFEVDPGKHLIQVQLEGYQPVKREVVVKAGDQISLLVNLKALPKYGRLQVEGVVGASIIIENRTRALLPMKPLKLPTGTYRVTVVRDGYNPWEGKININPRRLTVAQVGLTPLRGYVAKTVMFGSMGVSVASLITGTVFGILALRSEGEIPEKSTHEAGKQQALTADVFFAVAGATALATVITYLATRRGDSEADISFSALPSAGRR